ncbi:MAG: arginine deiminase family protein [Patescibacteria group bacterium]
MKPHSVDANKAMKQWQKLVEKLKDLGIKVDVIEQREEVPDMVFATDQGIVKDGAVLLGNFRYPQRKPERVYYREWFRDHGFRLRALSNVFSFEGGDALFFNNMLLVGTGFRANVASCEELSQKLNIDVIPLRLVNPYFYHLDMCFLPIDDATAFYFPAAFSKNSQNLLNRFVPNLLEFTPAEAKAFGANSFISGEDIIIPSKAPESFAKKLNELGMRIHKVDVNEFNKAGGGIHCLINTLE